MIMNHFRLLPVALFVFFISLAHLGWTQDEVYKDYLGIKVFAVDFPSYFDGELREFERYDYGLGLEYSRHIHKNFALGAEFHYAVVDLKNEDGLFLLDENMFAGDILVRYKTFQHKRFLNFDVFAGIGAFSATSTDLAYQIPAGVNFYFRLIDKWHLQLQGQFRYQPEKHLGNVQAGVGLVHLLGQGNQVVEEPVLPMADMDGDGIADALDDCPTMAGLSALNGCPDSDGDMVSDIDDRCPEVPGLKDNFGCPSVSEIDRDGDGTPNDLDDCPEIPGLRKNNGCPDSDLDGIVDRDDDCPEEYGQASTNGCPDTDGDGVRDKDDKCPNIAGTTKSGCPPIDGEDLEFLDGIRNEITFETGSSRLTPASKELLQQVRAIVVKYPGRVLSIEGHTDSTGSSERNQTLSEERAQACYNHLIALGISPTHLRYRGFGENNPIADNINAAGREENRRVEFHFIGE